MQHGKKLRDLVGLGKPLVDRLAVQTAIVGMHVLTKGPLALQHGDHFLLQIERLDDLGRAHAQLFQPVAIGDTAIKFVAFLAHRQQLKNALRSLACVAGAGVIDRHMQREVIRVDAQFIQFERCDEQMQRQLFIAQVVTNHLGKVLLAQLPQ